jgi:hypothetical protein
MPDAPPLPDPVSDLWEAANGLQHALTSLQRIEAFAMGALAVKEIVSPSHVQFNPLAFRPAVIPPAFYHSSFDYPAFRCPAFRPPTFHPPAVHPKIISSPKLQS